MNDSKKNRKRPYLALFLSIVFPGLGQLYNGQHQKGFIVAALFMIINFLASKPLAIIMEIGVDNIEMVESNTLVLFFGYSIAALFLTAVAMYDSKLTADKINKDLE
ncbi:MAG: DUF5683 domain-containing protein [Thermodesulfobacteriota bacterium]